MTQRGLMKYNTSTPLFWIKEVHTTEQTAFASGTCLACQVSSSISSVH